MQSLDAVDSKSFTVTKVEVGQVQELQPRLVQHGALERHAHETGKPLQPLHHLLHNLQRRVLVADNDGGEAQMRRHLRPRRQRFQKRRPLRAERAADVHDVDLCLPLHRLQQRAIPRNMAKRCPGTRILTPQQRVINSQQLKVSRPARRPSQSSSNCNVQR